MRDLQQQQTDYEEETIRRTSTKTSILVESKKFGELPFREKLEVIIHSYYYMVALIVLLFIDCLIVISEFLLDYHFVDDNEHQHNLPVIIHYMSIVVLSMFLIEICVRIYVLRMTFFHHKLEVFDAIVVCISLVLDIQFGHDQDATVGLGLLIVLRIWRVARLINGIVMSMERQTQAKMDLEKHVHELYELELIRLWKQLYKQEREIKRLQTLLTQLNVGFEGGNIDFTGYSVGLSQSNKSFSERIKLLTHWEVGSTTQNKSSSDKCVSFRDDSEDSTIVCIETEV